MGLKYHWDTFEGNIKNSIEWTNYYYEQKLITKDIQSKINNFIENVINPTICAAPWFEHKLESFDQQDVSGHELACTVLIGNIAKFHKKLVSIKPEYKIDFFFPNGEYESIKYKKIIKYCKIIYTLEERLRYHAGHWWSHFSLSSRERDDW